MYLIVGATGSLGGGVAKRLLERGEAVRALVRPASPLRQAGRHTDPGELQRLGAELVQADLLDPASFEQHLAGVKAVLTTASGTKRAAPDTTLAVDLHGNAALAALAADAGVEHLVHVSARGAGPEAPPFLRIKWDAEQALRQQGPRATFVRPAPFMQDWIGFVIGAQLQGGTRVQLVGKRDPYRTYVHEDDVARLLVELLLGGPPTHERHRTIEFSAEADTYSGIVRRMAAAAGAPFEVESVAPGKTIDTVPEPLASTITQLLGMMADLRDDTYTTPDLAERYGFEPRGIDDYMSEMLGAARG